MTTTRKPSTRGDEPVEVNEMRECLARFAEVAQRAARATSATQRTLRESLRPSLPEPAFDPSLRRAIG